MVFLRIEVDIKKVLVKVPTAKAVSTDTCFIQTMLLALDQPHGK